MSQPYWLEAVPELEGRLEVVNSVAAPCTEAGVFQMDVLVHACFDNVVIRSGSRVCQTRGIDSACVQALRDYYVASVSREAEVPDDDFVVDGVLQQDVREEPAERPVPARVATLHRSVSSKVTWEIGVATFPSSVAKTGGATCLSSCN